MSAAIADDAEQGGEHAPTITDGARGRAAGAIDSA